MKLEVDEKREDEELQEGMEKEAEIAAEDVEEDEDKDENDIEMEQDEEEEEEEQRLVVAACLLSVPSVSSLLRNVCSLPCACKYNKQARRTEEEREPPSKQ